MNVRQGRDCDLCRCTSILKFKTTSNEARTRKVIGNRLADSYFVCSYCFATDNNACEIQCLRRRKGIVRYS